MTDSDSSYARRPQGVRIEHPDGSSTPCELAYQGRRDGIHLWAVLQPVGARDVVRVAMLPSHTAVVVPLQE